MDDYVWDIFISYRRFEKWQIWLDKHFVRLLYACLQPELGKIDVSIFIDRTNLKEGQSWPDSLRQGLARSRILVPLICANYWDSDWCKLELAVMLEREKLAGFRQPNNLCGLIVPVIIHDGDRIPDIITPIQSFQAAKYARMNLASKAGLERFVQNLASRIAEEHRSSPAFDSRWLSLNGDSFFSKLAPKEGTDGYPRFA